MTVGLTEAGRMILVGIGFVALTALVFPAFGVLSALVWVMITALLVGLALRPRIQVSGNFPDRIVAGQTVQLTYTLRNIARLPAYHLWLGWDYLPKAIEQVAGGQLIRRLGPGESALDRPDAFHFAEESGKEIVVHGALGRIIGA